MLSRIYIGTTRWPIYHPKYHALLYKYLELITRTDPNLAILIETNVFEIFM